MRNGKVFLETNEARSFMAEQLVVIAYLTAKPGKEKEARKNIQALLAPTQAEKGCIVYDLHEMHGEPGKFVFYEVWKSAEHLNAHAKSKHLKKFRENSSDFLVGTVDLTMWRKIE
jgi:quinol monooxygenase YgiN